MAATVPWRGGSTLPVRAVKSHKAPLRQIEPRSAAPQKPSFLRGRPRPRSTSLDFCYSGATVSGKFDASARLVLASGRKKVRPGRALLSIISINVY